MAGEGEDELLKQANKDLFERKKVVLVKKGGASAVNNKFSQNHLTEFAAALKENPKLSFLEFIANLKKKLG